MSIENNSDSSSSASLSGVAHDNLSHHVQFYEDDNFLIDRVAGLVAESLEAGDGAIIVATEPHREGIEARLRARGIDLAPMLTEGRYLSIDAGETLTKLLVDGTPDATRFNDVIGGAIARAAGASPQHHTYAFGEMVALLLAAGKPEAALRLEALWNDLGSRHSFALLCGYPLKSFSDALDSQYLAKVCAAHSEVIPAESYSGLTVPEDRQRSIAHLQQKAMLLESEMAVRKKIEHELRNKIAELADADRRKNEFLAMLGHELRNPLSAVLNAITAADLDQSRRDRAIDIARRQTAQLARLVDDLLDVARITQGRVSLRKEAVSVMSIVESAIEETRSATDARQQRLIVIAPPDTRAIHIGADGVRIQQCVSNLIQNASKFTPARGRIEVSVRRLGADVAIRVRDTGIGIAPEMLPRVFDLFAQGDVAMDRAQGGLGIGLTLVKQLSMMHGGRVEARSGGLGKGSEFEIALPIVSDMREEKSTEGTVPAKGSSRVLIVEDNPDAAESLHMLLELLGHQVRVAHDAFVALDVLAENSFDVILVDIGLPGMDGYALAGHIRALPNLGAMRLVALTGYGQDEDRRRALAAGFDQHLVKPIDIDRLQALLVDAPSPSSAPI
jgi:signal transduction histidine kinase/ActR/RegA family two-component response regulator